MQALGMGLLVATLWFNQSSRESLLLSHRVQISGYVADATGNPIAGAIIKHANLQAKAVETGSDGRFTLETDAPAVVIEKPGYRSQRVKTLGAQDMRITLEKASKHFPVCGDTASRVGMDGFDSGGFYFEKVPGIKATKPKMDVDYLSRFYYIAVLGKKYVVFHGTGPMWGGSEPADELVWEAVQYEGVEYEMGTAEIVDARGVSPNGNHWRNLGSWVGSASYENVPPEAVAILDKLLDSACWKPTPQR